MSYNSASHVERSLRFKSDFLSIAESAITAALSARPTREDTYQHLCEHTQKKTLLAYVRGATRFVKYKCLCCDKTWTE